MNIFDIFNNSFILLVKLNLFELKMKINLKEIKIIVFYSKRPPACQTEVTPFNQVLGLIIVFAFKCG